MLHTELFSDTNTIMVKRKRDTANYQHVVRVPAFDALPDEGRVAALTNAVSFYQQMKIKQFCAAIVATNTIYTASMGNGALYLAVMNEKDDLVLVSRINYSLYSIEEELSGEEASDSEEEKHELSSEARFGETPLDNVFEFLDPEGNCLGYHQQVNNSLVPAVFKTELTLPENYQAYVLHDQSGLLKRLSREQLEAVLRHEADLTDLIEKFSDKLPGKQRVEKSIFVMATTVESNLHPKCLCFSDKAGIAENFSKVLGSEIANKLIELAPDRKKIFYQLLQVRSSQTLLEEVERLLQRLQPRYVDSLGQVQKILRDITVFQEQKKGFEVDVLNQRVDKLLFSIYLEAYKISGKSGILRLHGKTAADQLMHCLEVELLERFSEINKVALPKLIKRSNLANRILWFAGEKYPEFVQETCESLAHISEQKLQPDAQKKYYTNTGKLLVRLGSAGFAESLTLFKGVGNVTCVKKSMIEKFYVEHVEEKQRPK